MKYSDILVKNMPVSLHKMTGLTMTLKTLIMTNRLNLFI